MDIGLLSTIFRFILFLVQIYYIGIIYFFTSWVPSIRESKVGNFLVKFMNLLEPFRKIIPPIGIIDISSIAAIIVLVLFQRGLVSILTSYLHIYHKMN